MSAVVDPRPVRLAAADAAPVDWEWHRFISAGLGADLDPALTAERRYIPSLEPVSRDGCAWRDRLIVWGFLTGMATWVVVLAALAVLVALAALGRLR